MADQNTAAAGYIARCAKASIFFADNLVSAMCDAEEHRRGSGDRVGDQLLLSAVGVNVDNLAGLPQYHSFVLFISPLALADRWRRGATGLSVGYSEFTRSPPFPPPPPPLPSPGPACEPREVGLLSRPRALFKSRSVGPQAFHRFNLATHGNCST